jgi:hypothetical protein
MTPRSSKSANGLREVGDGGEEETEDGVDVREAGGDDSVLPVV